MLFNKGYAHRFEDSGKGWAEEEEGEKTVEGREEGKAYS
jgi:hypothetical protein